MVFLPTCVRWITNLCLLLALILTVFLLSGTTAPTAGVRNIHIVKLELNSTRLATVTSMPENPSSTPLFESSTASFRPPSSPVTKLTSDSSSKKTIPAVTATPSTNVPNTTPPAAKITAKVSLRKRDAYEYRYKIFDKYEEDIAYEAEMATREDKLRDPRAVLMIRDHRTGREPTSTDGDHPSDEGTIVVIGYFGVCAISSTTNWVCTKSRGNVGSLTGAPQDLLKLAASIQGAISPLPPIITITLQGLLIFMTCFLGCRYTTNLSSKLGQAFALLAFASLSASIFTAILFQSASGVLYGAFSTSDTMVASKGSGGIALAWAAVFFTGLAMLGVMILLLISEATQKVKNRTKELKLISMLLGKGERRHEHDVEIHPLPPVHHRDSGSFRTERGEQNPRTGDINQGSGYVAKVENMKGGNKQHGGGWGMI